MVPSREEKLMSGADLERIIKQEQVLAFSRFDEDVAFKLVSTVRELGRDAANGIGILVRLWDRPMAFTATKGYSHHNYLWCHRKVNTVRLVHKSTYRLVLERGDKPRLFDESWGVEPSEYVIAGGAFPIQIEGLGIAGAMAVSGLDERADHELVVEAICKVLGQDYQNVALKNAR